LLSTSTLHLAPNGHLTEEKSIEKQIAVKCNLKEARWEQVRRINKKTEVHNHVDNLDWNIFIEKYYFRSKSR